MYIKNLPKTINHDHSISGQQRRLTIFSAFDGQTPGDIVTLTGNTGFLLAGVGSAYHVKDAEGNYYWVKEYALENV